MKVKQSTSFCEQKAAAGREAKKLYYSGAWALSHPAPMPQSNKSLLVLFFRKEHP
jgi:hypothetical protein